jgi:phospholipase/lecithinase/hemolysin
MLLKFRRLLASMSVLFLVVASQGRADMVVFGDSLSETGNFSIVTGGALPPSPLYFNGRFSNGQVWIEQLAVALGEPVPSPSLAGGSNFAFNAARAAGTSPYGTPNVALQVESYLASNGGVADRDDIFVIWAGANDIFFGLGYELDFIPKAIESISLSIKRLHAAGARKFIVLDLPPLGQTPFFNPSMEASFALNTATTAFNSGLASELRALQRLPRIRISDVRVSKIFQTIARAPRVFGLRNVLDSATNYDPVTGIGYSLVPGVDPSRYLFWDSVHPTAKGHELIVAYAFVETIIHCRD